MNEDESDDAAPSQVSPVTGTPREWLEEFEAAARRPLRQRFRYAFFKTYQPVMDDAAFRAFDTTVDYRRRCERDLPSWLGYGRVEPSEFPQS